MQNAAYLFVLHLLFHGDRPFLILTTFILEPYSYHTWTKASHLDQLFLHEGVWSWISIVAIAQSVQLLLVQHRPHPRRLAVGRDFGAAASAHFAVAVFVGPRL